MLTILILTSWITLGAITIGILNIAKFLTIRSRRSD